MIHPAQVLTPTTVDEAREMLSAKRRASVLGGGTWLVPSWHESKTAPSVAVWLGRMPEATALRPGGCGAAVTAGRLARSDVPDVLRGAASSLVRPAVMNAVTVGGNLVAPGPRFLALALLSLNAAVLGADGTGSTWTSVDDLLDRPPRLLVAVRWKRPAGSAFAVLRDRPTGGAVLASVGASWGGPDAPGRLRIALGGATVRPLLCRAAMAAWAQASSLERARVDALDALEQDVRLSSGHARALARHLVGSTLDTIVGQPVS